MFVLHKQDGGFTQARWWFYTSKMQVLHKQDACDTAIASSAIFENKHTIIRGGFYQQLKY
jgi:hypothetical protein